MKYLSFDIEATGLEENDYIIEFAAVPFDTKSKKIEDDLEFHHYVKCPSFESLKPKLSQWVIDHNKNLIDKAHKDGLALENFKEKLVAYLENDKLKKYFNNEKIVLFGKSMNAIDLPFLNRDLSWQFMRKYFSHRVLDLSCISYSLIDLNFLSEGHESGSKLMQYLGMGEVAHTALEDAQNTALMYLKLLEKFKS